MVGACEAGYYLGIWGMVLTQVDMGRSEEKAGLGCSPNKKKAEFIGYPAFFLRETNLG